MSYCYCIVYERRHWHRRDLLINCVRSIRRFDPDGLVWIAGEASVEERLAQSSLLDERTLFTVSRGGVQGHASSIFTDMDDGLAFARGSGVDHVLFASGDTQFIRDPAPFIESAGTGRPGAHRIKTHHNVGGLPEDMQLALVEPLRFLFKDEVRAVGTELGLPDAIVRRQPFPGPGLAVRILGEVTWERLETLRAADAIFTEELDDAGLLRQHEGDRP